MDGLARAHITNMSTKEKVVCFFNPKEYTLSKQNKWEEKTAKGKQVPHLEYSGGSSGSLKIQLLFDTLEEHRDGSVALNQAGRDVRYYTRGLWRMMDVDPGTKKKKTDKGTPPHCRFEWGKTWGFEAVIESISEKFILFRPDGTPVRALIDLSLRQIKDDKEFPRQNPTSGGNTGDRTHTVLPGETLSSIAYQAYGDATAWRPIAEVNEIDDPRRLRPGDRLLVPNIPTL